MKRILGASLIMEFIKRHWVFITLLCAYLILSIVLSLNKPYWFDELCTLYIIKTGSIAEIIDLAGPADPHPPLTYFFILLSHKLFGISEFSSRLPSVLFIGSLLFAVYRLSDKYLSKKQGLVAIVIILISAILPYSAEGRPYAGCLAFTGWTYYIWLENKKGKNSNWLTGLQMILAACTVLTHFYAVLGLVPILLYDFIGIVRGDRTMIRSFVATCIGCLALLSQIPLMIEISSISKTHWTRPGISSFMVALVNIFWPLFFVILVSVSKLKSNTIKVFQQLRSQPEFIVFWWLALLVIYGLLFSMLTGAFHVRYVLPAIIGIAIITPMVVSVLNKRQKVVSIVLILTIGIIKQYASVDQLIVHNTNFLEDKLNELDQVRDHPVILSNPLEFLFLWHYSSKEVKDNIYYVIDYSRNFDYKGSSADISLNAMSEIIGDINVLDVNDFDAQYQDFYIDETPNTYKPRFIKLFDDKKRKKFKIGFTEYWLVARNN